MTAKEYLMRAWEIERRIERKIGEREALRARMLSVHSPQITGMPRGGKSHDWTDTVAAVIDETDAINAEIRELCRVKAQVREAIDTVEDAREREVLELRYRSYLRWEEIAVQMGYDIRWVYRLHGEGLCHVRIPQNCENGGGV